MRRRLVLVMLLASLAVACASGVERATDALSPGSPTRSSATPAQGVTSSPDPTAEPTAGGEPPIVVRSPAAGEEVGSPITVAGTADVFEATVSIRVLDANGRELAATFATATCGSGCRGRYSAVVSFFVEDRQDGTIEVFESSAEDGSQLHLVSIPVVLVP